MAEDWKTAAKDSYGWIVDLYDSVPALQSVIDKAVAEKWDGTRFVNAIKSTAWYKDKQQSELKYIELKTSQPGEFSAQVQDKQNTIETYAKSLGFTLSDKQLNTLANQALRFDWSDQELAQYVGTEITRKPKEDGQRVGLNQTQVAVNLRSLADKYGINLNGKDLNGYSAQVIKGEMSEQQITDNFRNLAKTLYPSLANQLDSGMTVTDIAQPYQNIAAQILEVDPTTIDISKPKYGKLFDFTPQQNGQARMMSQTEWTKYVRSLPEWKKTDNYRQAYSSMATNLARVFGKVI
jgi:hypothetical protein